MADQIIHRFAVASELSAHDGLAFGTRQSSQLEQKVAEIFQLLYVPLRNYLFSLLGDVGEAEDLAQDVFLRLFEHLQRGGAVDNVRSWVFRVGHNLSIDLMRSKQMEQLSEKEWEYLSKMLPDDVPSAEERMLRAEQRQKLMERLSLLTLQEQNCLRLRACGLRYREIAEVLGVKVTTVATFLSRGIRKLMA